MAINAFPIATVLPTASLVANVPAGIITATDVQAALNQLASAIPAPGSGTDPLFLVNGLSVSTLNTAMGNPTDRWAAKFSLLTDTSNVQPDFCNSAVLQTSLIVTNGQATYSGSTQAKESYFCIGATAIFNGSGQKFIYNNRIVGYGMSDTFLHARDQVEYAGGPVNGDEGCGWGSVSGLTQQNHTSVANITSVPTKSTVNTTTTQIITRSKDAQTVTIANGAGLAADQWVVIEQELPTNSPNMEAVKVISCSTGSPGNIQGIFRANHANGVTVTPALRLITDNVSEFGQDRVLVNMSATPYTTGQVNVVTGAGFGGTGGMNWNPPNGPVGGYDKNIGAIALTSDDYIGGYPFNGALLKSWYLIHDIASPTFLGMYRSSVAGDGAYSGKGVAAGPTAYTIRPAARILRIITDGSGAFTGELICDTSTSTWTAGNVVECVICPYPDVTGFSYDVSNFANGGTLRTVLAFRNMGVRTFGTCISIGDIGFPRNNVGADGESFGAAIAITAGCQVGLIIAPVMSSCAIHLGNADGGSPNRDAGGAILWGTDFNYLSATGIFSDNLAGNALQINTCGNTAGTGFAGQLKFFGVGGIGNPDANKAVMKWYGSIWMPGNSGGRRSFIRIDNDSNNGTDPVNFNAFMIRFIDFTGRCEIGSIRGGTATGNTPVHFMTDGVERMQMDSAGNVVVGTGSIATNANDGFLYIPTCAGPPTGSPTSYGGRVPMVYDSTNNKFYVYNGSWKGGAAPGVWS